VSCARRCDEVIAARSRFWRTLALLLAVVPALAGCGSSHPRHLSASERRGAAALGHTEAVLDTVHSLRLTTTLVSTNGQTTHAVADIALPDRLEVVLTRGAERSQVRLIRGFAYLHANQSYWRAAGAAAVATHLLTAHWFRVPDSSLSNAASLVALVRPQTLARCTLGQPGVGTVTAVRGANPSVLVRHAGATTDRITLASGASSMPVSDNRSGPNVLDATCGVTGQSAAIRSGTTTFARYNVPVHVSAPAHFESENAMNSLLSAIGRAPTAGSHQG
jgi:hypothetical protein